VVDVKDAEKVTYEGRERERERGKSIWYKDGGREEITWSSFTIQVINIKSPHISGNLHMTIFVGSKTRSQLCTYRLKRASPMIT
jgi:hypothetical protein